MKQLIYTLTVGLTIGLGPVRAEEVIDLDQAMRMALETDEVIDIQRRQTTISGLEVSRAWTIVSPRLTVTSQYERPETSIERQGQVVVPAETWRANITISQPLFDGRVLPARRLGLALESAAVQELAHTVRTSLFAVSELYYAVLTAHAQMEVAEQTVALSAREVDRANARYDAGEARRTEVLRAEVDEARARRTLVAARNLYEVRRSDLARRIGVAADQAFSVTEPPPYPEPEETETAVLYATAFTNRNDLAAARHQIEASEEQRTVIGREAWPTLDLEYNHRFVDPDSFTTQNDFFTVSAVARFEFWDGGNRRISRLQEDERAEQASLEVRRLKKLIQLEVQQAILELHTARETLEALRKEVDLAEENYRTLSEQARVGLATSLDVSTALNELDRARTERASQTFEFEVAKQRVEQATGRFASSLIEVEKP